MGSVRVRRETGTLFLDFRVAGKRVREQTDYADTPANRKKAHQLLKKLEAGSGHEAEESRSLARNAELNLRSGPLARTTPSMRVSSAVPTFEEFAEQWFAESMIQWRRSYRVTQRGALDKYLMPRFGAAPMDQIAKADLLKFRAELTTVAGRKAASLSPRRINAVMKPLRQILEEAADRYSFNSPFRGIKPLKVKRGDVMPFTLNEVRQILGSARSDYRAYFVVRFFTGMRTGEVHGLKWKYVDFDRGLILVRESFAHGDDDDLKTEGSHRDIYMSQLVRDALQQHVKVSGTGEYVFSNRLGKPIDNKNFVNRIWAPLLTQLGLTLRRPYQMRHTAATLWLAAGEAPEWIARQLGHTTTEMLFRVYSRYVPNLTRQDGSAFDRVLQRLFTADESTISPQAGL